MKNQHKIGANLLVEEICLLYVSCVSYMYHISICLENEHNLGANLLGEEIYLLYHIISYMYHISLCLLLMENEHKIGANLLGEEKALIHMQCWSTRDKHFRDGKEL